MALSENLIVSRSGPEEIVVALKAAWERAADCVTRIEGAAVEVSGLGRPLGEVVSDLAPEIRELLHGEAKSQGDLRTCPTVGLAYTISHGADEDFSGHRVCLFSHFDPDNCVDEHVLYYLAALKAEGFKIILISSNMHLTPVSMTKAKEICTTVVHRENAGFDFAGWALAMAVFPSIYGADELLVTNDSVYGPVQPLRKVIEDMRALPCDFCGLTESLEVEWHLQSYFILFRKSAIVASSFRQFWEGVRALTDKRDVIRQYEIPLASTLVRGGLRAAAYIRSGAISSQICNPTLRQWKATIIQGGSPFLKVQLLRDNVLNNDIGGWQETLTDLGFDASLITNHLSRIKRESLRSAE